MNLEIEHFYHCTNAVLEGIDYRQPFKGITRLAILDEHVDEERLITVLKLFPSLECFEAHTYWGGAPLDTIATALPRLRSLGFGERDLHRGDTLLEVCLNAMNALIILVHSGPTRFSPPQRVETI